jgi:hypothetical protein
VALPTTVAVADGSSASLAGEADPSTALPTAVTADPLLVLSVAAKADVTAAFALFLDVLSGPSAAADRLPKKLRPLAGPAVAGDGPGLLAELAAAARSAHGESWATDGRTRLAREVQRRQPSVPKQRRAA